MQALMKSVKSTNNRREIALKTSITNQLIETIKEIQLGSVEEAWDSQESKNRLCSIIESMFLHGLKDSLAHRFRRAIADIDQKPEPSFWPPLLIISHSLIIEQITSLSQITTEIGQCRAWIRLALNDALLSSYLKTIRQNPSALKSYYNTYAYVRDLEILEVAQELIEGVESIELDLPTNSSLLNTWMLPSLLLAGIWSTSSLPCPISSGVDVAQSIKTSSSPSSSLKSLMSHTSSHLDITLTDQDEVFKILSNNSKIPQNYDDPEDKSPLPNSNTDRSSDENNLDYMMQASSFGNSLNRQSGWSFDDNQVDPVVDELEEPDPLENAKSMEHSFNAVIKNSYTMLSGSHIQTPDFSEIWQRLESLSEKNNQNIESPTKTIKDIIPPPRNQAIVLAAQVTIIPKEKGLDTQNYSCSTCKDSLSLEIKPHVCGFTGEYFCDTCMAEEAVPIPARIIHNWDFKKYSVSQKAYKCLEEIRDHPVIDFKTTNPYIYTAVEEMAKLQVLRNELNYLRAYLYTCREPIIEELQKQMCPREYMYEHIHQYSISDLMQIKDGTLAQELEKVVQFGTDHVLKCWLCSQKGFLCEICKQSKALFPFDTKNVYRCNLCRGVYHKTCFNASKPCPRCKRKKKRDDLPLLEATLD